MNDEAVLNREQLRNICELHGFDPPTIRLNEAAVPPELRPLVPYAEIWGHADSDVWYQVISETPPDLRQHVIRTVLADDMSGLLSAWLGGDETRNSYDTPEYLGLSYLGQAAERLEILDEA